MVDKPRLVTEQSIGYDGAALVRQIATFNTIDPALTSGCAEYFGLQPAPAEELPPTSPLPPAFEAPY